MIGGVSAASASPRVGVVGHVEWVQFALVSHVPVAGEIIHAREVFSVPGGGGAVAAVQLRRLAGEALFLTALGTGHEAELAARGLRDEHGVTVRAGERPGPQRRTFTFLDDAAERTITVLGKRIVPHAGDPLPWDELGALDAIYLTGGDAGAVRAARAARVLVATPRAMDALVPSGVRLDVLVGSSNDPGRALCARDAASRADRRRADARRRGRHMGGRGGPRRTRRPSRGSSPARREARGRRPRCPAHRSTRTAAATRSPQGSPMASAPA